MSMKAAQLAIHELNGADPDDEFAGLGLTERVFLQSLNNGKFDMIKRLKQQRGRAPKAHPKGRRRH